MKMQRKALRSLFIGILFSITSSSTLFGQGVFLTPGSVYTYGFSSLSLIDQFPGHGQYYNGRIAVSEPGQAFRVRVELFESSSSLLPFLTTDHNFPPSQESSVGFGSGRYLGLQWFDHKGFMRLTYEGGAPAELSYLVMGISTWQGHYQTVAVIPEPANATLLQLGTILGLLWFKGQERRITQPNARQATPGGRLRVERTPSARRACAFRSPEEVAAAPEGRKVPA